MPFLLGDTVQAKNLAGQPTFDAGKLEGYHEFVTNLFIGVLGIEFSTGEIKAEYVDGGEFYFKLSKSPIIAVSKIEEVDEQYNVVKIVDPTEYVVRKGTHIIERREFNENWDCGKQNFKVTYTFGFDESSNEYKIAYNAATFAIAAMILMDVAGTSSASSGGVQSWTVSEVTKVYGGTPYGNQITMFWSMAERLIKGIGAQYGFVIQ